MTHHKPTLNYFGDIQWSKLSFDVICQMIKSQKYCLSSYRAYNTGQFVFYKQNEE